MAALEQITILGATGSIGIQVLDIISQQEDKYQVFALTANTNISRLAQQCHRFKPQYAVVGTKEGVQQLKQLLGSSSIQILFGSEGIERVAANSADIAVAAIVGAAGLLPTLAALKAGKKVLLANKESLVMAGELFMTCAREYRATLLPIDSEHNALFQCLPHGYMQQSEKGYADYGIEKITLTASGGPFLNMPLENLSKVTPEQACNHPNWSMGNKICVDSATMMNKGLEVIEAYWLFGLPLKKIDVIIHPQSIIHGLVTYTDGSVLAQSGPPDMRIPISHALAWPNRLEMQHPELDLAAIANLSFSAVDNQKFPCLNLAKQAMLDGGTAPAIMNAANESAVAAFLNNQISFTRIVEIINEVLNKVSSMPAQDIDGVLAADHSARLYAAKLLN